MRSIVASDLSDSAYDFQRVVWPAIASVLGDGQLIPVESVSAKGFTKELDMLAGIDAWQLHSLKGIRGIASRVQWPPFRTKNGQPYESFTIRKSRESGMVTEFKKRVDALERRTQEGWIAPAITVQAYVSAKRHGHLLRVGVARTEDLIRAVQNGWHSENSVTQNGAATFYVLWWKRLKEEGVRVWTSGPVTDTPVIPLQTATGQYSFLSTGE